MDEIVDQLGPDRASYVLDRVMQHASSTGVHVPLRWNTPYVNTIPPEEQVAFPGARLIERRIKSLVRWNAIAMVVRANKHDTNIGGHLATYASLATLLEVGDNHFFRRAYDGGQAGGFVDFRGHAAPGAYAPALLESRLSAQH